MVQGRIDKETKKLIKTTFLKAGEKGVCQIKVWIDLSRLKGLSALKSMSSCTDLVDSLFETKASNIIYIQDDWLRINHRVETCQKVARRTEGTLDWPRREERGQNREGGCS